MPLAPDILDLGFRKEAFPWRSARPPRDREQVAGATGADGVPGRRRSWDETEQPEFEKHSRT